jgi:hypothetical protein
MQLLRQILYFIIHYLDGFKIADPKNHEKVAVPGIEDIGHLVIK